RVLGASPLRATRRSRRILPGLVQVGPTREVAAALGILPARRKKRHVRSESAARATSRYCAAASDSRRSRRRRERNGSPAAGGGILSAGRDRLGPFSRRRRR